jgi:hypothetical protein
MITKQYAGAIGFAFVAAWAALGFGDAILCLIGAVLFAAVAAFWQGELDLGELQDRLAERASRSRPARR